MYVLCKCTFGSILGFINVSIKLFVYIFGGAQCPRLHLQIDTKLGRDLPRHRLQPRPGLPHRGLDLVLGTASQFYIRNIRRRPLFVPSSCVQCRYLRLSWVGSGLGGSMFVVMAKCMLRDPPSPITVIVHTNQLYTDRRSTSRHNKH